MTDSGFHIDNNDRCITTEEMIAYQQGSLSSDMQHRIEAHLLDCEFCSDAMEGVGLMENPASLAAIESELNAQVDELTGKGPVAKIRVMFPWRIAAAFALIFISTLTLWLILPKHTNQELFTSEYKPYPAPSDSFPVVNNTLPVATEALQTTNESSSNKKTTEKEVPATAELNESAKIQSENLARSRDIAQVSSDDVKMDAGATSAAESERPIPTPATFEEKQKITNEEDKYTGKTVEADQIAVSSNKKEQISTAKMRQPSSSLASKDEEQSQDFEQGLTHYKNNQFSAAIPYFEKCAAKLPQAYFYAGVSYLSIEKSEQALNSLNKYLNSTDKQFEEAAWWYKALAALKSGDKKSARKFLEKVQLFKGEFEQQSGDLLRKL